MKTKTTKPKVGSASKINKPKVTSNKEVKVEPKLYKLYVDINDNVTELETDNLFDSIKACSPEFVRTSLTIRVTKDGKTLERFMYANKAKILFQNRIALEVFINNLIF